MSILKYVQRMRENNVGPKDHYLRNVRGVGDHVIGPMTKAQAQRIIEENPDIWFELRCFRESADELEADLHKRRIKKILES